MESLYLWVPVVLLLTLAALLIYVWAVRSGQYDDLERDSQEFLFDRDNPADSDIND